MAGSFESSDNHSNLLLKPLRVPTRHEDIFQSAKEMIADLPGWELVAEDPERGVLTCRRQARPLGGESTITILVEGPDEIPTTTVTLKSVTASGLLAHDKKNVLEFMKLFYRRVI